MLKGDIVLVDDQMENLNLLSEMLTESGHEVRKIKNGQQALKSIYYEPPELILLDIMMPEIDGYEVCLQIKQNSKIAKIPVIFISAKDDVFDKVRAFRVGGVDYIIKPFFLEEVLCRVETHLNNYRYQTMLAEQIKSTEKAQQELELAYQQLQKLVNLDGLTGISNRRYFDEFLTREWQRLQRDKQNLSLIMIDIDYFKFYNDTYGHLQGDDILRIVAQTIAKVVKRPADLVARYGGEEFAVILPNTTSEGAEQVAKNILTEIRQLKIPHEGSLISEKYVTLSIGVSSIIPTADKSLLFLIEKADSALFSAKKQGRNRIVINDEN